MEDSCEQHLASQARRRNNYEAVLLYAYGDPAQLHYEETDMPKFGDNEVLVKVHATSVNPIDLKLRSGAAKSRMPLTLPAKTAAAA
jgi:NADPH:quinone reductase-like Zn-dependent oxidoreductase